MKGVLETPLTYWIWLPVLLLFLTGIKNLRKVESMINNNEVLKPSAIVDISSITLC